MRPIEFRAYLKYKKKIVDVIMLEPENKVRYDDDDVIEECDIDECELMQFTGLYDKNGKEICEGDIVKVSYDRTSMEWNAIVRFGIIKEAYKLIGYYLEPISESPYNQSIIALRDLEVIGNIYENKELIGE